jgi:hypothetical protein
LRGPPFRRAMKKVALVTMVAAILCLIVFTLRILVEMAVLTGLILPVWAASWLVDEWAKNAGRSWR